MASSPVTVSRLEDLANALYQGLQSLLAEVQHRQEVEAKQLSVYKCIAIQLVQTSNIDSADRRLVNELQEQVVNHDRTLTSYTTTFAVTQAMKLRESVTSLSTTRRRPTIQTCPVAGQSPGPEDLEIDFTTPRVQGNLECPFAKMQHQLPITPSSIDPIAAELHQEHVSVQASDGAPNVSKCPIRFLDQHSPEEVAKYFENHKHEIPRSHEICVKRYQQNEHSIRELDAKYGNLVNMIQGLGVKHKQYLPEKEVGSAEDAEDRTSIRLVEEWAERISQPAEEEAEDLALDDEDRVPRSEKPLREIRVGESPSRPWGISVPVAEDGRERRGSFKATRDAESALARSPVPACIFRNANKVRQGIGEERQKQEHLGSSPVDSPAAVKTSASAAPQIVFNGPVFFGYSAEQATSFLLNMNMANMAGQ